MTASRALTMPTDHLPEILEWPHPILRKPSTPVKVFDAALADDVELMWRVMYAAPGIGLAAPQIADPRRIFVMDCRARVPEALPLVCVNPELINLQGSIDSVEGCLSLPELKVVVPRASRLTLRARDVHGECFAIELDGLEAICAQHEYDHLEGRSFLDLLEPIARAEALSRYQDALDQRTHDI